MKKYLVIVLIISTALVFMSLVSKNNEPKPVKFISIEKALKDKLISAKFIGKGGYQGECMELNIESLIPIDTIVRIEPGRRLVSDDSTIQDILIIKEIQLFLAAGEKKEIDLFGFCCEASRGGPYTSAGFRVGYMADSTFIYLAEYLGKSGLPLGVMQSAVWVLSDNHSLNSISNENESDKAKMKELFQLLARLKKIEYKYPWYSLKYRQDSARLFSNRPVKLLGEFEYALSNPSNVDLVIRTAKNQLLKNIFVNRPHHPDTYTYRFTLDVANWPKGKYYMILYVDNQQFIKREFEL